MTDWSPTELAAIDSHDEVRIAAHRPDGTLRTPRIIWHVVEDGALYVRSVRGAGGAWYQGVQRTGTGVIDAGGTRTEVSFTRDDSHDDAIDRAYRTKYGSGPAVDAITHPDARATTLRVERR